MAAAPSYDGGPAGGPSGLPAGCGFPSCDGEPVTDHGMCDLHRRVAISRTGSWLEVG